jgi:hypothetical protein
MQNRTAPQATADAEEIISRAVEVWRKAQVVYDCPPRLGYPEALAVAEEIAKSHPECESLLIDLLLDNHQLVVAYSLLTLKMMKSAALQNLPADLLQRRSNIKIISGSFANGTDLGGLTREIQKRARQITW